MAGCIENHVQLMASVRNITHGGLNRESRPVNGFRRNIMYGGLYRESRPVNGFSEEHYVWRVVSRITSR